MISVLASLIKPRNAVLKVKPYGLDDEDEGEVVKRIFGLYL